MNDLAKSMDQIDLEEFNPKGSPLEGPRTSIELKAGPIDLPCSPSCIDLSGSWEMAAELSRDDRLGQEWPDAIEAKIPCSVHTALLEAGCIPDPYVGLNDEIAYPEGFRNWWLRKRFPHPGDAVHLKFHGVFDICDVWLNGHFLGSHRGMFGEFEFQIAELLTEQNELVVRLHPAPFRLSDAEPTPFFEGMNIGWLDTATFNNSYGWHYINLPTVGIWRPVILEARAQCQLRDPFVATLNRTSGLVHVSVNVDGPVESWAGVLKGQIVPANFQGQPHHFEHEVTCEGGSNEVRLEFEIPNPQLWWPADHGNPDFYRLSLGFESQDLASEDRIETNFGLRTIEMRPLPDGPSPDKYNWTFVINGRAMFIKGANWCTMDALMRFERSMYERFFAMAKDSHIHMLRAWGSGMPETDDFFDLADRYGVMILQEWPTAWNSHAVQPLEILDETVRHTTLRIRNHPSLVMYGAGNESGNPVGEAINMMGRYSVELDGTRPYHRAEPWGGSVHNYDVYWGRQPLDKWLAFAAPFIGEFGVASLPALESTLRFVPEKEHGIWPPKADGSIAHHMPVFSKRGGLAIHAQYVGDWVANDCLEHFILGIQMTQATGMRHVLELNRTRWPQSTGVCYYKLNDNNPASAWSTVDWYGTPKIAYHILKQAFAPLHACILFPRISFAGEPVNLPVFLLDDAFALAQRDWKVRARVFGQNLEQIALFEHRGLAESWERVRELGTLSLTADQTFNIPLLVVTEVLVWNQVVDRTFYWLNYPQIQGCLFDLPPTQLRTERCEEAIIIVNEGTVPAVGVHFHSPEISDRFSCSDSYIWLDPQEKRTIATSHVDERVQVQAWNAPLV